MGMTWIHYEKWVHREEFLLKTCLPSQRLFPISGTLEFQSLCEYGCRKTQDVANPSTQEIVMVSKHKAWLRAWLCGQENVCLL
jgi:hypothetical protein